MHVKIRSMGFLTRFPIFQLSLYVHERETRICRRETVRHSHFVEGSRLSGSEADLRRRFL
jgi:hypothetical protein